MSSRANRKKQQAINTAQKTNPSTESYCMGVDMKTLGAGKGSDIISVFDNKNFTISGSPKGYNIETILRNRQNYIYLIYELMSYYLESDAIFGGAVKKILTPFSCSGYHLHGSNEKTKEKYLAYYENVGMNDLIRDIFFELYTYGNCYIYDRGDWFDIFPAYRIRISSIGINGEPVLEYQIIEFAQSQRLATMATEGFIDSVKNLYRGYPQEILDGIDKGSLWVQLDPSKTYTIQDVKSRYEKYAIPFGMEAIRAFQKKQLISLYEDSQLNLGMKGFIHIQAGDKDVKKTLNSNELASIGVIFKNAINGFPLAVTAWNVNAKWIETTNKLVFDKSKYASVNADILSACGLSSLLISGDSEGGSFAQAQVNVNTCEKRIESNQRNVCEFIKKVNRQRAIDWRIQASKIPDFLFNPINLANDSSFKDQVVELFTLGLLSRETVLDNMDFDFGQEKERKTSENAENLDEVFKLPPSFNNQSGDKTDSTGAPVKSVNNSKQDKNNSSNVPKPSTVKK